MRTIFLDIDGVLNNHQRHENGVCGIKRECVVHLNEVLATVPDVQLVISSSWRYYLHNGFMNAMGFNLMLQTHGLNCHNRIAGITEPDRKPPVDLNGRSWYEITPEERAIVEAWGAPERVRQIRAYVAAKKIENFVVVDDIDLPIKPLIRTVHDVGLTAEDAGRIIHHFKPNNRGELSPRYERHSLRAALSP